MPLPYPVTLVGDDFLTVDQCLDSIEEDIKEIQSGFGPWTYATTNEEAERVVQVTQDNDRVLKDMVDQATRRSRELEGLTAKIIHTLKTPTNADDATGESVEFKRTTDPEETVLHMERALPKPLSLRIFQASHVNGLVDLPEKDFTHVIEEHRQLYHAILKAKERRKTERPNDVAEKRQRQVNEIVLEGNPEELTDREFMHQFEQQKRRMALFEEERKRRVAEADIAEGGGERGSSGGEVGGNGLGDAGDGFGHGGGDIGEDEDRDDEDRDDEDRVDEDEVAEEDLEEPQFLGRNQGTTEPMDLDLDPTYDPEFLGAIVSSWPAFQTMPIFILQDSKPPQLKPMGALRASIPVEYMNLMQAARNIFSTSDRKKKAAIPKWLTHSHICSAYIRSQGRRKDMTYIRRFPHEDGDSETEIDEDARDSNDGGTGEGEGVEGIERVPKMDNACETCSFNRIPCLRLIKKDDSKYGTLFEQDSLIVMPLPKHMRRLNYRKTGKSKWNTVDHYIQAP